MTRAPQKYTTQQEIHCHSEINNYAKCNKLHTQQTTHTTQTFDTECLPEYFSFLWPPTCPCARPSTLPD